MFFDCCVLSMSFLLIVVFVIVVFEVDVGEDIVVSYLVGKSLNIRLLN